MAAPAITKIDNSYYPKVFIMSLPKVTYFISKKKYQITLIKKTKI